jgi:hypothetical protein
VLAPGIERSIDASIDAGTLVVEVPVVDPYAILVAEPTAG